MQATQNFAEKAAVETFTCDIVNSMNEDGLDRKLLVTKKDFHSTAGSGTGKQACLTTTCIPCKGPALYLSVPYTEVITAWRGRRLSPLSLN